jgi:hypothetical protein
VNTPHNIISLFLYIQSHTIVQHDAKVTDAGGEPHEHNNGDTRSGLFSNELLAGSEGCLWLVLTPGTFNRASSSTRSNKSMVTIA